MAKKGDKSEKATNTSGTKPAPKNAPKNAGKNGAARAKATQHVTTGEAATPGPPAPATEPLGRAEAGRSVPTATASPARTTAAATPSTTSPSTTSPSTATASALAPATTSPAAPTSSTPTRSTPATGPAGVSTPARGNTVTDEITHALLLPVHVAQRVLPARRVPIYAGAAALALIGVIEWPVALGAGLAWEALRRWGPDRSER